MKTIAIIAILSLTGCTLTVSPDGSRSYSPHAESIRIILEK
jgi:hypothetical protein